MFTTVGDLPAIEKVVGGLMSILCLLSSYQTRDSVMSSLPNPVSSTTTSLCGTSSSGQGTDYPVFIRVPNSWWYLFRSRQLCDTLCNFHFCGNIYSFFTDFNPGNAPYILWLSPWWGQTGTPPPCLPWIANHGLLNNWTHKNLVLISLMLLACFMNFPEKNSETMCTSLSP